MPRKKQTREKSDLKELGLERLLSTSEAAELLGVAPRTIQHWIRTGRLPAVKMGNTTKALWKVEVSTIREFIAANRTQQ
jgi:excisionase family DNA binding protein